MSDTQNRMVRMDMSNRQARQLAKELRADFPQLDVEVWAIAQGLSYINVQGPVGRGVVTLCLHSAAEVAEFRKLANDLDNPPPGSARWNDKHRPFGPDTTMA